MRGAWAAFARDPFNGLTSYGWPEYSAKEPSLVRLAYRNQTGPNVGIGEEYDGGCRALSAAVADPSAASSTSMESAPSSALSLSTPEITSIFASVVSTSVVYITPSPGITTSTAAVNYASHPRNRPDITLVWIGLVLLMVLCMNLIQGAFFLVLARFLWLQFV